MTEEDQQQRNVQHRAYKVLGQMMERMNRENLPVIAWTLSSAKNEAILAGLCEAVDPIQRQNDFESWSEAIGAEAWPNGIKGSGGVRLSASVVDHYEEVTITLSAFIAADEM